MLLINIILYLNMSLLPGSLMFSPAKKSLAVEGPPRELCQLFGSVYVTDNPQRAGYYVYVEEYETSADLSVFVEENKLFASQSGLWHYTDKEAFADVVIFFTESKGMADFSIYYTDVASFAGCRN